MKASEIHRGLPQYRELNAIEDYDEFIYCIVYEFAIREIKADIIEMFKVFRIENDNLVLNGEEIQKQIFTSAMDKQLMEEVERINPDLDTFSKIYYYWVIKIKDELMFQLGLQMMDLHIDYFFFNDEFKAIFYKIINNQPLFDKKQIYNSIDVEVYKSSKFTRVTKRYPKMDNDEFREIKTHYQLNYIRPILSSTILSENKKADISINTDLPKELILQQVSKLIDIMQSDNKNIVSNKEMNLIADKQEYDDILKDVFRNKENFVDKLIIYDYIELRREEIKQENYQKKLTRDKKIGYIESSNSFTKQEKKEEIIMLNQAYRKTTLNDVRGEIATILNLSIDTIKTYEKDCKKLLKNRNYLNLIHGKNKGVK